MNKQWSVVSGQWSVARARGKDSARTTDHGPRTTDRRGISLMEVLISIGIMAIGMVSIASLIPAGGLQVQKANVEERKAELGLNAFREFQIRGMGDPTNWLQANGTTPYLPVNNAGFNPPLVIDPFMVAVAQADSNKQKNIANFPASNAMNATSPPQAPVSVAPAIARVTISAAYNATGATSKALAESIMMLTNDLVVLSPNDRSKPAVALMIKNVQGQPDPEDPDDAPDSTGKADDLFKRQFEGNYSWLAMLAPQNGDPSAPAAMNQYVLSIVIFDRRRAVTPTPGSGQEEMLDTQVKIGDSASPQIPTAGNVNIGGGDIVLTDASTQADAKLALARPGNWMMLCRNSGTSRICQWYRIISANEGSTTGTLDVTLAGPDWVWGGSGNQTYACLFENAVAVYERTIHLEGPSLWNQ